MRFAAIAAFTALAVPALAGGIFDEDCKHTGPRRAATPAAGITKVVIHAEAGSLNVEGTQGASQIVAAGTACTSDEDFLPRITLKLRKSGSTLHVDADIPEKSVVFGFFSARLDLNVTLPAGLPVAIEDGSGWIKVARTGPTSIEDGSGAIDVNGVTGNVEIEDSSGELTVRNVSGVVEIEDGSGAITVERVESLRIRDDGSGSITVENVRRDVTIDEDGSGAIQVADVGGNFTVARKGSGAIDYERVSGRVSVPSRD